MKGFLVLGVCVALVLVAGGVSAAALGDGEAALAVTELHAGRNELAPHAFVLEDPAGELTFAEVRDGVAHPFRPLAPARESPGHSSSVYWLRFRVRNTTAVSSLIVELQMTPEVAELYDGDGPPQRSGTLLPFGARGVADARIAFRVTLAPGHDRTYWVRQRTSDTLWLDPAMWPEVDFWESRTAERLFDGICYGVILGLAVYNLFLFLATRDRSYLLYVVFQITNGLAQTAFNKYTFQYLWPDHPVWAMQSVPVLEFLVLATGLMFARACLDVRRMSPRLDTAMRGLAIGSLVLAGVWMLARPDGLTSGAARALAPVVLILPVVGSGVALASTVLITVAGVACAVRPGATNARVFLVAWAVLLVGTAIAVLASLGAIAAGDGFPMMKLGSAVEAVLLSLALASRINRLNRERELARPRGGQSAELCVRRLRRAGRAARRARPRRTRARSVGAGCAPADRVGAGAHQVDPRQPAAIPLGGRRSARGHRPGGGDRSGARAGGGAAAIGRRAGRQADRAPAGAVDPARREPPGAAQHDRQCDRGDARRRCAARDGARP
ncbi:MAG: hypothetical protein E6J91_41735 [Deltaproteobacteria bacterium]|nr:MAG: hypothetical protein E6J91_41735 [Deltaproteobacteria bacterium]